MAVQLSCSNTIVAETAAKLLCVATRMLNEQQLLAKQRPAYSKHALT
jgi:hypothetical protein